MTAEEHQLIVFMFGIQEQKIKILIDLLKSKGIMDEDDFKAFEFAARSDAPANVVLAREVATRWASLLQKTGVPLPQIPKTPSPENR